MSTTVELKDYTDNVLSSFDKKVNAFLLEVKDSVASQAPLNSPVVINGLPKKFRWNYYVGRYEKKHKKY